MPDCMMYYIAKRDAGGVRCRYCGSRTRPLNRPNRWGKLRICRSCTKVLWPDGTPKNPVEGKLLRPSQWCLDEYREWVEHGDEEGSL